MEARILPGPTIDYHSFCLCMAVVLCLGATGHFFACRQKPNPKPKGKRRSMTHLPVETLNLSIFNQEHAFLRFETCSCIASWLLSVSQHDRATWPGNQDSKKAPVDVEKKATGNVYRQTAQNQAELELSTTCTWWTFVIFNVESYSDYSPHVQALILSRFLARW